LGNIGRPEQVDALRFEQFGISRHLPRIGVEVLSRAELQGIDEDRDHHMRRPALRLAHQGEMAFVQCAHRRDQCHRSGQPHPLHGKPQWINPIERLHRQRPLA
jgi:hypothetical protein